jgi:hypothetical protein
MWTNKVTTEYKAYTLTIEITQNHCFLEITSNDVLEWYKTVEKFTYTLNDLQEMLIAVVDYRNNVGHWISSNEVDLL